MEDRRIVGPAENFDDVRAELPAELNRVAAWNNEFREVDNDRDFSGRFPGSQCLKIQSSQKIAINQLQSGTWLACLQCVRFVAQYLFKPICPIIRPFSQPNPAPAIVFENHIVALEHDIFEETSGRQQPPASGVFDNHDIENVSVDQKLGNGSGFEQIAHL